MQFSKNNISQTKEEEIKLQKNKFFFQCFHGGDERIRTADPLLARQVLSQLSYTPRL